MKRGKNMVRPQPRTSYDISTWLNLSAILLLVLKDAFRAISEFYYFPVPANGLIAIFISIVTIYNLFNLKKNKNYFVFVGLAFLYLASLVIFLSYSLGENMAFNVIFGYIYSMFLIPVFVLTSGATVNYKKIIDGRFFDVMLYFMLFVGFFQIGAALFYKKQFIDFLLGFYNRGLIAYPLQTSSSDLAIRIPGIFYSAFSFSLLLNFFVARELFFEKLNLISFLKIALLGAVLAFTLNRNGYFIFVILISVKAISAFIPRKQSVYYKAISTALVAIIFLFPFLAPLVSLDTQDSSLLLKSSTFVSRASSWQDIFEAPLERVVFGTGYVQGLGADVVGRGSIVVDNLFLATSLQSGILCALLVVALMWSLSDASIRARETTGTPMSVALILASLFAFNLNIVFYEAIFQALYMTLFLSVYAQKPELKRRI